MSRLCVFICLLIVTLCNTSPAQDSAPDAGEAAIRQTLGNYIEAFNDNSAADVAAHWADNAVYVDSESGTRLEGREAIQGDFNSLFERQPGIRLSGEIDSINFVTENVAIAEGEAVVYVEDTDPSQAHFSVTFVREDDRWLLHTVQESETPVPVSSWDALQPLAFLIGDWVDQSGPTRVDTSVNWSPGGAFLIRSFVVQNADGPVRQGTQVIGWDPRSLEIRSWSFNSDGSFGDAVWTDSEDHWLVRTTQTLADGAAASGTYVVTPIDNDSMTMQLIGHEIEGEPQPASDAVTIVRTEAQNSEAEASGGDE